MDSCINIERFKNALFDLTNNCELSVGTAYFIIKDFYNEMEKTYIKSYKDELNNLDDSAKKIIGGFGDTTSNTGIEEEIDLLEED